MLRIKDATIEYPASGLEIAYPNLEIAQGEFVGIFGDSGSGKSSLFEAILAPDFPGVLRYSELSYEGQDLKQLGTGIYKLISYCPQYAQEALNPKLSLREQLALFTLVKDPAEQESLLRHTFDCLQLDAALLDRYPSQLSGGEKQRAVLVACMLKEPEILFLDEPSSAIDLITMRQISEFLISLKGKLTVLMSSHDKEVLAKLVDAVVRL
jgi:ABC-type glutathione transport system ATPase component